MHWYEILIAILVITVGGYIQGKSTNIKRTGLKTIAVKTEIMKKISVAFLVYVSLLSGQTFNYI